MQTDISCLPLISGLPDDLALDCLARVPRRYHHVLKCVSKRWRELVCSEEWQSHREKHKLGESWIYALCRGPDCARLYVLDPPRRCWKLIDGIPGMCAKRKGMACQALGNKLYLLGGCGWSEDATSEVYCYDILTNMWAEAAPMSIGRCYFACEALNGKLYAVGGVGLAPRDANSWDTYYSKSNIWTPRTDPRLFSDVEQCFTLDGKVYIRRGGWCHNPKVDAVVYDPSSGHISQPVSDGLVTGWHGPAVVVDGTLYMLDQSSGVKLMMWNQGRQEWLSIGRLSPLLANPPCQLAAIGRSIFVVGKGLSTLVLDLDKVVRGDGVMVSSSIPKLNSYDDVIGCKAMAI